MHCSLLENSYKRRKYVIYPDADSTYFIGNIVAIKYNNYWDIELMNVVQKRQGYGSFLLNYVINDLKNTTNLLTVHPVTKESLKFFQKHNFKSGFQDQELLFYLNV